MGVASPGSGIEDGNRFLAESDWEGARAAFDQALAGGAGAGARDGLGHALWWLGRREEAMEQRAKAFAEYRGEGRAAEAANVAAYLAGEYRISGNASLAAAWLGRAERLLEGCGDCAARVWVEIERSKRVAAPGEGEAHARAALEVAQRLADPGLEGCAISHLGLARISAGAVEEGMRLLDESIAIATGGEAEDPLAIGDACCTSLLACERLPDPGRARDWGRAISDFVERRRYTPLASWCRAVYAGFLIATGRWEQAEQELEHAAAGAPAESGHDAQVAVRARLAQLRVEQGRFEEAAGLLSGIENRPQALAPVLALDLATAQRTRAIERIDWRLRSEVDDASRAWLLLVRVRALLEQGKGVTADLSAAREAARSAGRHDLVARAAVLAAGAALRRGSEPDVAELETAIETLGELGLPLEQARARVELARCFAQRGTSLAIETARSALGEFERLGAAPDADRAAALLRELGAPGRAAPRGLGELTRREHQVFELLAGGLSNKEIADRLVISPRTAEHHVRSILGKLGLRNRAAAAALASRGDSSRDDG